VCPDKPLPLRAPPALRRRARRDARARSYTPATPHSRLLLQALSQLCGPRTRVFMALSLHHNPHEVRAFLRWAAQDWGFEVCCVSSGIPPEYVVPDVLLARLRLVDSAKAAAAAAAAAAGRLTRWDDARAGGGGGG
jgi:hypothetical protein